MALPKSGKTHVFTVDHKSEVDETHYRGQFTCKKRSMMDVSKISVRRSQLNGGMYCVRDDDGKPTGQGIPDETEYMNHMIAELEVLLVQKPEWFKLEEIGDSEFIQQVYKEVAEFQATFRSRGSAGGNEGPVQGSEAGGAAQPAQPVAGNPAPKVVGPQVPASLDA